MTSTEKWVQVLDEDGKSIGVRMLHKDRRGHDCVRYQRDWWRVERDGETMRHGYKIVGRI